MRKIDEEDIHKAVAWLRDTAQHCAEARATRLYLDAFTKSLKAILMRKYNDFDVLWKICTYHLNCFLFDFYIFLSFRWIYY